MNREIKFRTWDNQNKKMIYPGSKTNDTFLVFEETGWFVVDHFTGKHETILKSEDGILMQYIGLKDKNDKEIYEGDKISSGNLIGIVCFGEIDGIIGWHVELGKMGHYPIGSEINLMGQNKLIEVIGNIYENK